MLQLLSYPALFAVVACGPTASNYCERLHDVQTETSKFCPELVGDWVDPAACPDAIEASCSNDDLELLHQKLDCFELVTVCGQHDALSECQSNLGELSRSCAVALDEVTP